MPAPQRLSALDAMFVGIEGEQMPMHIGAILRFEAGAISREDGSVDIERIRAHFAHALPHLPRYRQRIARVPLLAHPVWVDDPSFDLNYHLRHVALPRPGSERQLKRMVGRIFSQPIDRNHPLWEMYIIEGLEDGGFALVGKVHHAMVDGLAGVQMIAQLLRVTPDASLPDTLPEWVPMPPPSGLSLLRSEIAHRKKAVLRIGRSAQANWRAWRRGEGTRVNDLWEGVASLVSEGLHPASNTAINPQRNGPYRRIDSVSISLADMKIVKNALGGTINDVILATCAGALRRYFVRRGEDADQYDNFRVLMPMSTAKGRSKSGNQVSLSLVRLPIAEPKVERRYQAVVEETKLAKNHSHQSQGVTLLEEVGDAVSDTLLREGVRMVGKRRPFSVMVTNVPGPPIPLYLLGCRLKSMTPLVPLFERQALAVGVFSYNGQVTVGLTSDWHQLPELHELRSDFEEAFNELLVLAQSGSSH